MRIKYDPKADAVYVKLSQSGAIGAGQTVVNDLGVIVDTGADGQPKGLEFLSVRSRGLPTEGLPQSVANAIREFTVSGALDQEEVVESEYE